MSQEVERTRKQDRDDPGRRHRLNARFVNIFEVIGREGSNRAARARAVRVRELIGVQLHLQAVSSRGLEHTGSLFRRETNAFAKGVDALREPFRGNRRNHLGTDQIDKGVFGGGLGREGVSAQERGRDVDRASSCQLSRDRNCLHSVSRSRP